NKKNTTEPEEKPIEITDIVGTWYGPIDSEGHVEFDINDNNYITRFKIAARYPGLYPSWNTFIYYNLNVLVDSDWKFDLNYATGEFLSDTLCEGDFSHTFQGVTARGTWTATKQ
ncbi:hypothetical protein ACFL4T_14655, partial [candidate division KSB1 bacterium]